MEKLERVATLPPIIRPDTMISELKPVFQVTDLTRSLVLVCVRTEKIEKPLLLKRLLATFRSVSSGTITTPLRISAGLYRPSPFANHLPEGSCVLYDLEVEGVTSRAHSNARWCSDSVSTAPIKSHRSLTDFRLRSQTGIRQSLAEAVPKALADTFLYSPSTALQSRASLCIHSCIPQRMVGASALSFRMNCAGKFSCQIRRPST